MERVRKKSEYFPQNSARATWQLELERFNSIVKLSSE
jgi:transcriptional antiterminator Rof (Rho-off)